MYYNLLRYVSCERVSLSLLELHRTEPNSGYEGPMTLRFKFPRPRLGWSVSYWPAVIKSSEQPGQSWSTNLISQLSQLSSGLTTEFVFSIVSSSVLVSPVSSVMQFSGSSDHINHLSSNFNSPLLLIEQKYRH